MDADPEPDTAILFFIIIYIALVAFSYAITIGARAIAEANDKKVREAAEIGDKKAIHLEKLIEKRSIVSSTTRSCSCLAAMLCVSAAIILFMPSLAVQLYEFFGRPSGWLNFMVVASGTIISLLCAIPFSVFGIILPKKLGAQDSEKTAYKFASLMRFVIIFFAPFSRLIYGISHIFVKIFGGNPHIEDLELTEDEILSIVDEGEEKGVIEESQKEMINNIFEFDDLTAGDVMTHRTEIIAIETSDHLNDVVATAIEEGYSRIPVYEEELDNIKGIIYVKDLLKYVGNPIPADLKPSDIMHEAMFIPETKKCRDLFSEMTEKHLQMVVVADEYGGVAGIVTVEDLIESIVGNIQDEFDDEHEEFIRINDDVFNIDGTLDIHAVEDLLEIEFPEGDYDTIAGFIMSMLGRIPEQDERVTVEYEGFLFTVVEMDDRRIVRIVAERLPEDDTDESEE